MLEPVVRELRRDLLALRAGRSRPCPTASFFWYAVASFQRMRWFVGSRLRRLLVLRDRAVDVDAFSWSPSFARLMASMVLRLHAVSTQGSSERRDRRERSFNERYPSPRRSRTRSRRRAEQRESAESCVKCSRRLSRAVTRLLWRSDFARRLATSSASGPATELAAYERSIRAPRAERAGLVNRVVARRKRRRAAQPCARSRTLTARERCERSRGADSVAGVEA